MMTKKNQMIFMMLFVITICFVILQRGSATEEYIISGYTEEGGFPQNGAIGEIHYENQTKAVFLPDGLKVTVADTDVVDQTEMMHVHIQGLEKYVVSIDSCYLTPADEYNDIIDLPKFYADNRTVLFASIDESDVEVKGCYPADSPTSLTVLMEIGEYYYVSDGVIFGFVHKEDGYLMHCDKTHRQYSYFLQYFEDEFLLGIEPDNPRITSSAAIEMVKEAILEKTSVTESVDHLNSLQSVAYYNISHEYGKWGPTWFVIIYGSTDELWCDPNPYFYTPFFEIPFIDGSCYDISDDYQEMVLTTAFPDEFDPTMMHIHYMATVIIDRDEKNVFFRTLQGRWK